jgi:hypothetical protein
MNALGRPRKRVGGKYRKSAEEATANWAESLSAVTGIPPEIIAGSEAGKNYAASQVQRILRERKKRPHD